MFVRLVCNRAIVPRRSLKITPYRSVMVAKNYIRLVYSLYQLDLDACHV